MGANDPPDFLVTAVVNFHLYHSAALLRPGKEGGSSQSARGRGGNGLGEVFARAVAVVVVAVVASAATRVLGKFLQDVDYRTKILTWKKVISCIIFLSR